VGIEIVFIGLVFVSSAAIVAAFRCAAVGAALHLRVCYNLPLLR
jgi:hypothetical protein